MEYLPDGLERLTTRLEALEQRVCALEHSAAAACEAAAPKPLPITATGNSEKLHGSTAVAAFSVLGKAMLGVAGAYLLRAVAESNVLPSAVVAASAIAYALAWLRWASRAKTGDWFTGTVYAGTSALILAPMLWELMFRFNVLTARVAAAVVAGFAIAAWVLTRKHEKKPVWWVANLAAAGTALALGVASRELIPFISVLLTLVLMSEFGEWSGVRVPVSLAADAAVCVLIFIYSSQASTRESYPQLGIATLIAPGLLLFLLCGIGVIYRTVLARKRINVFEAMQASVAFLLAACSIVYLGQPSGTIVFGIVCLVLATAGYALVLTKFRGPEERRNLLVFASWSGALMLAGSMMGLPAKLQPAWMGSWAVAASWLGPRILRLHFQLHALAFLLTAAAGSGLLGWMVSELTGTAPNGTEFAVYPIAVCAIGCYLGATGNRSEGWQQQTLAILFAVMATGVVTALLVQGLTGLVATEVIPGAHHVAFIRTLSVCSVAIALAFGGAQWNRAELKRVGYAVLAALALKLAAEDLRLGHLGYVAAAIALYAITLILVPRLARMTPKAKRESTAKDGGIVPLPR